MVERRYECFTLVCNRPVAQLIPGYGGTSTRGIPTSARELRRVQRTRSAESDESKASRILAFFLKREPQIDGHARVHDAQHTGGRIDDRETQRLGNLRAYRAFGELRIEAILAGERRSRAERTENDVGIGHRRLVSSAHVTRRSRHGARAARTDFE